MQSKIAIRNADSCWVDYRMKRDKTTLRLTRSFTLVIKWSLFPGDLVRVPLFSYSVGRQDRAVFCGLHLP